MRDQRGRVSAKQDVKMAAPVNVGLAAERGEMSEMKMMEEEMSR